jgi:PAS domain S-box-containing protein
MFHRPAVIGDAAGCNMPVFRGVWPLSSAILKYGFAVLCFAVTFAVVSLLHYVLDAAPPVAMFLCAIIFIAWIAGLGPALLAAALSALAFGYFYLLPVNSFTLASRDLPRIVLFGAAAVFIASVSAAQQTAAASLRRARDHLQDAVEDLRSLNEQLLRENAERSMAEQKTLRAERDLQTTIDTIPVLVTSYRPDGSREFVNRAWREFTGLSLKDVAGRAWSAVHPNDRAAAECAWRESLAMNRPFRMQLRFRRCDGQYRWQLVQRVALRDENGEVVKWYSVASDIEDQKRAEDSLRKNQAYLDQAQQLSHTGSFGWNIATGDIIWSKEAYQILGFDRTVRPTIGLVIQCVPTDEREPLQRQIDRFVNGEQDLHYEHGWICPDGRIKQLHVRARRVVYESEDAEVIGALMDVTEARRAEEAMADAQAQLAHANRVATLGEMSASIAHEVNQPLSAIMIHGATNLRLLGKQSPDIDEVRRGLEQMIEDADRASRVVNRIRALARKNQPERVTLNVNDVINEAIKMIDREITARQVSLTMALAPDLPAVVGDRVQLQQAVINLAINAIQAMDDKDVRNLIIRSARYEADQVLVSLQDTGPGIDAENANGLFDAFYTTKPAGMGMGLSICRSIVEAHGGRIWAANAPGAAGALFQFTLPISESQRGSH